MGKYFTVCMFILTMFLIQSCVKEEDVFIPDAGQLMGPDTTWYAKPTSLMPVGVIKYNLAIAPDVDSIDNTGGYADFISSSGLECSFAPESFVDSNGNMVQGKIAVESNLLLRKGDFLQMTRPTSAGDNILVSGGAFLVRATQNGKQLKLAADKKIKIKYVVNTTFPKLSLYNGDNTDFEKYNWIANTDTLNGNNNILPSSSGYEITCNQQNWMSCNYKLDTAGKLMTGVSTTLPSTYTNSNTVAFVVFNDLNVVMGMYGDKVTKAFISGKIPAGISVTVVTITKEGNLYFLGHNSFVSSVSSSTSAYQKVNINPAKASLENIKAYLKTL